MNAQIIIPALVIGAIAAAAGSKPKRRSNSRIEEDPIPDPGPGPGPGPLPMSNQLRLDPECFELTHIINAPEYDARITTAYWSLRQQGMNDPVAITAELLRMDAPQCAWPAVPGVSSPRAVEIWNGTLAAVENYHFHAENGTLDQFEPVFGW